MIFFKRFLFNRVFICYLTISFLTLSFASSASGMFIPSQRTNEADLEEIRAFLELKIVQHKLSQLGLTKEEIEVRLHQLDDEQIHQIASQIRAVEAGSDPQDSLDGLVFLLGVVIFLAVVFVVAFVWVGVEAVKQYYDLPSDQRKEMREKAKAKDQEIGDKEEQEYGSEYVEKEEEEKIYDVPSSEYDPPL